VKYSPLEIGFQPSLYCRI